MLQKKKQPRKRTEGKRKMILEREKDLQKELKGLTYKDIKDASINITIYTKPNASSVFYDVSINIEKKHDGEQYDEKNYISFYKEGLRVGGWGYDRWSTALSNALNLLKNIYKIKSTLKRQGKYVKEYYTKDGRRVYGLYEDGSISYGIGTDAVLNAVKYGFSNVKLTKAHYGKYENFFSFKIKGAR